MAFNEKLQPGIQLFRGSRPKQGLFSKHAGDGCCGSGVSTDYDKLPPVTRADNSLTHLNPGSFNSKFLFPYGDGFETNRNDVINGINTHGVGYNISVLAIPTYAFVTGVAVHIEAEEPGLTFDLVTRNGLELPTECVKVVDAKVKGGDCEVERTLTEGSADTLKGFGKLGPDVAMQDIFARDAACGQFSLESDEIALRVASMPASGRITGKFRILVSVNFDILNRAEM